MESCITLKDMRFHAYHGVLPQEAVTGNDYIVNLKLYVDVTPAMVSDDIKDTVDYAAVYRLVKTEMDLPSKLLEHVCGRIVRRLFDDFGSLDTVCLTVEKLNPPMGADMRSAAVSMTVRKGEV